jgi:hypothetical protein
MAADYPFDLWLLITLLFSASDYPFGLRLPITSLIDGF